MPQVPLSIVIPVRIESADRLANLQTVIKWYAPMGLPIYILEAAPVSKLVSLSLPMNVSLHYIQDNKSRFHRTHYINVLLQMVDTDYAMVLDADVIVPLNNWHPVIEVMRRNCLTIAYPYNGEVKMLTPSQTSLFAANLNLTGLKSMKLHNLLGRKSCGGAYIVDRARYQSIGGENERFVGWGPEDAERLRRAEILGHKVAWVCPTPVYHLHHTRPELQAPDAEEALHKTRKEFVTECCMTPEQMMQYVRTFLL